MIIDLSLRKARTRATSLRDLITSTESYQHGSETILIKLETDMPIIAPKLKFFGTTVSIMESMREDSNDDISDSSHLHRSFSFGLHHRKGSNIT